jgi:hypothetical protein
LSARKQSEPVIDGIGVASAGFDIDSFTIVVLAQRARATDCLPNWSRTRILLMRSAHHALSLLPTPDTPPGVVCIRWEHISGGYSRSTTGTSAKLHGN